MKLVLVLNNRHDDKDGLDSAYPHQGDNNWITSIRSLVIECLVVDEELVNDERCNNLPTVVDMTYE